MAIIIPRRREGTWEGVPVEPWFNKWICRMRGGLVHHTIMIPAALSLLRGACSSIPTIFQNDWFCTRISYFFQSPIFSIASNRNIPWSIFTSVTFSRSRPPLWYKLDRWNRYKVHRGIELVSWHKERPPSLVYDLCHDTRRGLFWPLLVPMGQVWHSQPACPTGTNTTCSNMFVPLEPVVLVPLGQVQPVPIRLSHWERLSLSQLLVPVGQVWYRRHPSKVGSWPILGSFLIKNRRGPNWIWEISYQKSLSNSCKIETKNRYFFTFSVVN